MELRGFVPSEECLKCDRCCRFTNRVSPWIPVFSVKEIEAILQKGYPASLFNKVNSEEISGVDVRVSVKEFEDFYICPFFNPEKNCCDAYPVRSFDCMLYPFLLVKKDGEIFVAVDRECPYVKKMYEQDEKWRIDKYVEFLVKFLLSPRGRDEIGSHPSMIAEYPGNLDLLRQIKF